MKYISLFEDVFGQKYTPPGNDVFTPKPHPNALDLPYTEYVERPNDVLEPVPEPSQSSIPPKPKARPPIPNGSLQDLAFPPPPKRPEKDNFREKFKYPSGGYPEGEGAPNDFHGTQSKPYGVRESYFNLVDGIVNDLLITEWNASSLADKFTYDSDALERHENKASSTLEKEKDSTTPKSVAKRNAANFVLDAAGHIQNTYDEYSGHPRQDEAPQLGADDISAEYDRQTPNIPNKTK